MAIFCTAVYAILSLVAQNLSIARGLSLGEVDFGTPAAEILSNTNFAPGSLSGDFGDAYPGAVWAADITLVATNAGGLRTLATAPGLYQVDLLINWPQNGARRQMTNSFLVYRSQPPGGTGPRLRTPGPR